MTAMVSTEIPAVLRFAVSRKHRSLYAVERFDVTLGHHKLGVMFTGDGAEMVPVVNGVMRRHHLPATRFESRLSNASAIRLGDVLVGVNGMDTVAMGLERAMALIASTKARPMKLTFQRLSNETASSLRSTAVANAVICSRNTTANRQPLRGSCASTFSSTPSMTTRRTVPRGFGDRQPKVAPEDIDLEFENCSATDTGDNNSDENVLIVWKDGPLGLTLTEDDISGLPLVNRLTGKGTAARLQRVHHGYLLASVNGITTEGQNFAQLCKRLASMEKPVLLVFSPPSADGFVGRESFAFSASSQRSSSLERTKPRVADHKHLEYDVVWRASEKLGLVLGTPQLHDFGRSSATMSSSPAILRVQPSCALHFKDDPVGDVLVSVNNRTTSGLRWEHVRLLLDCASKPAVLRFRRLQVEDLVSNNTCLEHRRTESLSSIDSLSSRSSTGSKREESEFASEDEDGDSDSQVSTSWVDRPLQQFSTNYNLLWSEGSLGIAFDTYEDSDQGGALVVYVKRLLPNGHAKRTRLVMVGDRLVHINRIRVEVTDAASFYDTMRVLEMMSKPVVLGFQRPMVEVGESSLCGEC